MLTPTAAATPTPAESAAWSARPPPSTRLTPDGYGPIRIGLRPGTVRGRVLTHVPPRPEACYVAGVKGAPGVAVLVRGGVIRRVSIGELSPSPVRTDRGLGLGSTRAAVLKAYPGADVRPHRYVDAPAAYLTWLSPGGRRGFRFETDARSRVTVIHAGATPDLELVERCG